MAIKLPILKLSKMPAKPAPAAPRQLVRTVAGAGAAKIAAKPASREPDGADEDPKGMSFRFGGLYRRIISDLERKLESNKTDVVKLGLRHLRTMYGHPNVKLVINDVDGNELVVPIITDGVPH